MRNIFFYANKPSTAFYLAEKFLRQIPLALRLVVLPPGSGFTSPASLEMRSNDLMILFALDDSDIKQFIRLRKEYESFRIILLLNHYNTLTSKQYALLSPRFVAYGGSNFSGVHEYLTNIIHKEDAYK